MLYTTLDVLRPAQAEFAPEVENLLIVNNSKVQPENFGHTTRFFTGQMQEVSVPTDSVSLFALSVLTDAIDNINFFNSVDLLLNSINRNTNFSSITPLPRATVVNLSRMHDADAILSLDHIAVRSDVREYIHHHRDLGYSLSLAVLEVRYESWWSIHYPNSPEVVGLHFRDSLIWESDWHHDRVEALEALPYRYDALIDGALFVGQNSVRRFLPFWEKSDRFFFNPSNRLMRQAIDSVVVQNWESALELWKQVFESSENNRLRAESANNIAIAYEILGDFDEALKYAKISYELFNTTVTTRESTLIRLSDYIQELQRRKVEILLLNRQLGIF